GRVDRVGIQRRGAASRSGRRGRSQRGALMDQLVSLLGYEFVQNAIAAGFVIAIVSGVVSGFVVARNMSFAVHALAELGFTGSAGFLLVHLSPVLGLLFGSAITAVFIGTLGVRARGRDVVAAVAEAIQVVGVLLSLTLLITPGAAAERLTPRPGLAIVYSVAIALLCTLGGILLSLITNAPVSVFVTSLSFASYLVARFAIGPRRPELRLVAARGSVPDVPAT